MMDIDPIQAVAIILSVGAVWLTAVRNPLCWPVGLASVLVYGWIFIGARLYSDALLQGIFAVLEIYGWWQWRRLPHEGPLPAVRSARPAEVWAPLGCALLGAVALGGFMARYTDAALPWLDAALTALSLVAQYWMARMIRANWVLWIGVDVVYVGVYWVRDLPPTAALYAGFVVLAGVGWWRWGRAAGPHPRPLPKGEGVS